MTETFPCAATFTVIPNEGYTVDYWYLINNGDYFPAEIIKLQSVEGLCVISGNTCSYSDVIGTQTVGVALKTIDSCATPMISPEPGIYYDDSLTITIAVETAGATIRYTIDGSTPSETNGIIYTAPVNISTTTTLQAIAYKSGMTDSSVTSGVYTFWCIMPTFSPVAGTYTDTQNVTIAVETAGATIRYTIDGSTPSESNGTVYSAAVVISTPTTLKAIAYKSGFTDSAVTSGVYTIGMYQLEPTIMLAKEAWGITIPGYPTLVGIIDFWEATSGYNAYLCPDGSWSSGETIFYLIRAHSADAAPSAATIISTGVAYTAGVTEYDGWASEPVWLSTAIPITTSVDIFTVTRAPGFTDSVVGEATFLVDTTHACEVMYMAPVPGPYIGTILVGLYSNTEGSSIRYTTDGETAPTESVGTLYTGPLTISTTTTIKAIAYKTGLSDSPETDGTYTITAGSRAFIFG